MRKSPEDRTPSFFGDDEIQDEEQDDYPFRVGLLEKWDEDYFYELQKEWAVNQETFRNGEVTEYFTMFQYDFRRAWNKYRA